MYMCASVGKLGGIRVDGCGIWRLSPEGITTLSSSSPPLASCIRGCRHLCTRHAFVRTPSIQAASQRRTAGLYWNTSVVERSWKMPVLFYSTCPDGDDAKTWISSAGKTVNYMKCIQIIFWLDSVTRYKFSVLFVIFIQITILTNDITSRWICSLTFDSIV